MLRVQTKNLHSWKSLLRTTRASISVLAVVGLALVLPAQISDELVALEHVQVGPLPGLLVLQFSLGSLALSSWYWARAALAARFGVDDTLESRGSLTRTSRRAFDAVPRVCFLAGVVLSLILVWRSPSWLHAASVAGWSVPAYLLIRWRLALITPQGRVASVNLTVLRSRRHVRQWLRVIGPRVRALLLLAPFGPFASVPLLGLGAACFAWGAVESFVRWDESYPGLPALASRIFPGPSVALIGCALMIGPLTALVFAADGLRLETVFLGRTVGLTRPPILTVLLAWSLAAPNLFTLHAVRVLDPERRLVQVADRRPLTAFFADWTVACAPDPLQPVRPIVVALSGGASRAGIWAAQVLAAVDAASGRNNAAVFAVSSVSGGSLGAAAYMAAMQAAPVRCSRAPGEQSPVRARLDKLNNVDLGGDAIGPLLAGALLADTPRALFSPVAALVRLAAGLQPHGGDRAEALERAFESLWHADLARAGMLEGGVPEFSSAFLSLAYDGAEQRPGMPAWIVNGTDLTGGGRMLTTPFGSGPGMDWPFRAAGDVLGLLGADVAMSTAIDNGSRFPFLEPPGELVSVTEGASQVRSGRPELLDGGYFDNEGLQTALELADWLARQDAGGRRVEPVIVQATADADIDAAIRDSVVRCPDHPLDKPTSAPPSPAVLQALAPIVGLNNVRGAHAAVLLREVRDRYCDVRQRRSFFHFYLFSSPDRDIPLNWLLSPDIVAAIRAQLSAGGADGDEDRNGNDTEWIALRDLLDPPARRVER